MSGKSRWIHIALAGLGFVLLFWMVRQVGFGVLRDHLAAFGMGPVLGLVAIYALAQLCFCLAWFVLLPDLRVPFSAVFKAYAAGDSVNMTVPSANLAGEPVKVLLIREYMPVQRAISSLTIYKYSDWLSMTLFLLCGWLFHFIFFEFPIAWNIGAGVVISGMVGLCVALYFLQQRGLYHPTGAWLSKTGLAKWIVNKLESAHFIDESIREFYAAEPGRFALSVFFNFLAWFGGVIEIMIFLKLSGHPASFATAWTVETFSLFINNVIFFVPARIGVAEGGRVLLFAALGYPQAVGLSYGIIRRVRELSWIGIGLLLWIWTKKSQDSAPEPAKAESL